MRPRLLMLTSLLCALAAMQLTLGVPAAVAGAGQDGMFEDDPHVMADPAGTLQTLRNLGVDVLRLDLRWNLVAPRANSHQRPRGFNAADPGAYPARNWAIFDTIVRDAERDGITINMDVGSAAPLWATGPGAPNDGHGHPNWEPSPKQFGAFVHAAGVRYSGNYDPRRKRTVPGDPNDLPRVSFWSGWNEPNLGFELAPQGVPGKLTIENSGHLYRQLIDQQWGALHQTGHGNDTILIGETAPRGSTNFGVFAAMKPLVFLRALYCVDSHYRPLRGSAAKARGCPTTVAGSHRFRAAHPALFQASGYADHMWMRWYPPNREAQPDPNYASMAQIGGLERALDRLQSVYGSTRRFPIYDTEFGYITAPPNYRPFLSPTVAAAYLNWAEYLSWRSPRVASFAQYLVSDPAPTQSHYVGWSSGLYTYIGKPKATLPAWRMPLYLPATSTRAGKSLEVWGCVRPSHFAILDSGGSPQTAEIEFKSVSGGGWTTLQTATISDPNNCYFDVKIQFPHSGSVRVGWSYPPVETQLVYIHAPDSQTVYSRTVQVTVG